MDLGAIYEVRREDLWCIQVLGELMDGRIEAAISLIVATIIVGAFDPIISLLLSQDATAAAGTPSQGIFQALSVITGSHIELIVVWILFIAGLLTSEMRGN